MAATRPTEIRLGFAAWSVVWSSKEIEKVRLAEKDPHVLAYCDYPNQVIILEPGSPASDRVRLLHELLHACIAQAENYAPALADTEHTEEDLVRAATPWLLEALTQNPEFVAYLTGS